jgi:NhaP-type Na+/H+ or K+/H+ antiporter
MPTSNDSARRFAVMVHPVSTGLWAAVSTHWDYGSAYAAALALHATLQADDAVTIQEVAQ